MSKCTVALPVYNGENYLDETIQSILNQNYAAMELVITDDGSTDGSREIIERYAQKHPNKLTVYHNKYNLGVGRTLQEIYRKHHDADYFAMIGQDDVWPQDYLSKQIAFIQANGLIVSFAHVKEIDQNGAILDGNRFDHQSLDQMDANAIFLRFIKQNFLCAPASVVNLSLLDKEEAGTFWGYNNDRLQDYELWLHLCLMGKMGYNKDVSMFYRSHSSNLSDPQKRVLQEKLENYGMFRRVLSWRGFYDYIETLDENARFIKDIVDALYERSQRSIPFKLLTIDLCEHLLNHGYVGDDIIEILNRLYMESGLVTKCLKDGRELPQPIAVVFCRTFENDALIKCVQESPSFQLAGNEKDMNSSCIGVVAYEQLNRLSSKRLFKKLFKANQIIISCKKEQYGEIADTYPSCLIIHSSLSPEQIKHDILAHVEDKTSLFRNGLLCNAEEETTYFDQCKTLIKEHDELETLYYGYGWNLLKRMKTVYRKFEQQIKKLGRRPNQ